MSTFDAGSATGTLVLDISKWAPTVDKATAEAAVLIGKLASMAVQCAQTSNRFAGVGVAAQRFASITGQATAETSAKLTAMAEKVSAGRQGFVLMGAAAQQGAASANTALAGTFERLKAATGAAAAFRAEMKRAANLHISEAEAARPRPELLGSVAGTELAVAGMARFRHGASAAVEEAEELRERMFSVATQAAATSASFVGIANGATLFSSLTNTSLLKAIARMQVLRQEAKAADTELAKMRFAGRLNIPDPPSEASRSAAEAVALTALKGTALKALVGVGTLVAVTATLKKAVSASIEFEDSFAGVRKTIDGSEEEFAALKAEILDMSTRIPVAATTLNTIAEAAGQLGIQKDNISAFVDTIAKVGVATNMTEDEAATAFAQWANITQMPQQQVDRLASTVVRLGNETASTERQIVGMGLRLAGAGHVVGLTDAQIAGLSATLASLGLEEEAAGTAFSTVMFEMAAAVDMQNEKLKMFAALSGQSAEAFTASFKRTPSEAIEGVVRGLEDLRKSGGNVTQVLETLGLSDRRVRDAMVRISGSADFLRDNLAKAGKEWKSNTALQDEAARRFETTSSKITLLKNGISSLAVSVGDELKPALDGVVGVTTKLIDLLNTIPGMVEQANAAEDTMGDAYWNRRLDPAYPNLSAEAPDPTAHKSQLDMINERISALTKIQDALMASSATGGFADTYPEAISELIAKSKALNALIEQLEKTRDELTKVNDAAQKAGSATSAAGSSAADGFKEATNKAAEIQKAIAAIANDRTPEQIRKMAEEMKNALPAEAIKAQLKEIILAAEKAPDVMTPEVVAKNMAELWRSNRDGVKSVEDLQAKLTEIPEAYRAQFVEAARAADAQDRLADASKKAASAAASEKERMRELGAQVNAELNAATKSVEEFAEKYNALIARGLLSRENVGRLAGSTFEGIREEALSVQDEVIAGVERIDAAAGAEIEKLRDREMLLGSEFYRGLSDGPDIIGTLLEKGEDLKKAATYHPDAYGLFGAAFWKDFGELSDAAVRSVEDSLARIEKAYPDMEPLIAKVRSGLSEGLEKIRVDAGKELWKDLNPQIEVGLRLKEDATSLQKRLNDLQKGIGGQALNVNIVPVFDARKLTESFLGSGLDAEQALENLFGENDASKSFIDGLLGHKSNISKELLERVKEAVDYAGDHLNQPGVQSALLHWEDLLGLGSAGLDALVGSIEMQIGRLNAGIETPPAGIGIEEYKKNLEEVLGLLNRILPAQAQVESDEGKDPNRLTDEERWAKPSSDMDGWAGIAEDIMGIGDALGQVSPKFAKVAQAAQIAGDIIRLAMSPDPVSLLINGLKLAGDAMGLFGDETEEVKTGMDRAFEEMAKSVENWVDQFTDSIIEFVKTGEASFKEFVDGVLEDMMRIVIKYAILQPMLQAMGIPGAEFAKGGAFEGGNIVPFAKGAAFNLPEPTRPYLPVNNIVPFATGGVIEKPTLFDIGLMGEAGPEAIMPLERSKDGSLGVRALGVPASGARIEVQVIDQSTRVTEQEYDARVERSADGAQVVRVIVRDAVRESLANGSLDRDLALNFGLKRRAQ